MFRSGIREVKISKRFSRPSHLAKSQQHDVACHEGKFGSSTDPHRNKLAEIHSAGVLPQL
jgi:hypothetical protein